MKAYIAEVDWADEGDVFFFSIVSGEELALMRKLIRIYMSLGLLKDNVEMYWGTNEYFYFNGEDFLEFISGAEDISEEELSVFEKFNVKGFDIYDRILDALLDELVEYSYVEKKDIIPKHLTQRDLDLIKPVFLKLFTEEDWNRVQNAFNSKTE